MSNGFRPEWRSHALGRAGTDDDEISRPCCGTLNDFTFGSSKALQEFCSRKIAVSFLQDILGRGFFRLAHLFAPGRSEFRSGKEAFTLSFHPAMRPGVNYV